MPLELISPEEQKIRKKAEEKIPQLKEPKKPKEHKEHKEPKEPKEPKPSDITKMIVSDRKRKGGIPIIPGDPCCAKICESLNNKIERKRDLLNATVALGGGKSLYKSAIYRSLIYQIEALEDHRQDLKDRNTCGCIEDTGAVSIIVPLIQAQQPKEEIPITDIRLVAPSPKLLKEKYQREKSIIPPTNSCCPESCKLLNDDIDNTRKTLDNMELRGGPGIYKNPRYEALSSRMFALQDYRSELKNKESCKCVE